MHIPVGRKRFVGFCALARSKGSRDHVHQPQICQLFGGRFKWEWECARTPHARTRIVWSEGYTTWCINPPSTDADEPEWSLVVVTQACRDCEPWVIPGGHHHTHTLMMIARACALTYACACACLTRRSCNYCYYNSFENSPKMRDGTG